MGALPPAATRGHRLPLLELQAALPAGPAPRLPEPAQPARSLPPSSPAANTAPEGETGPSQNIFHPPAREGGEPGPGLGPSAFAFRKLVLSIASLAAVSAPASAPSFFHRATSPGSIFPLNLFLLLRIGIQNWAGSPAPKPPPSRRPSPTANSGNALPQIKYTLCF